LQICSVFVLVRLWEGARMNVAKEQQIIRLWNRLRRLQREGRSTTAVLRELERVLAEREHAA
jgi:type IV secretory pathway VirB3-like protein